LPAQVALQTASTTCFARKNLVSPELKLVMAGAALVEAKNQLISTGFTLFKRLAGLYSK